MSDNVLLIVRALSPDGVGALFFCVVLTVEGESAESLTPLTASNASANGVACVALGHTTTSDTTVSETAGFREMITLISRRRPQSTVGRGMTDGDPTKEGLCAGDRPSAEIAPNWTLALLLCDRGRAILNRSKRSISFKQFEVFGFELPRSENTSLRLGLSTVLLWGRLATTAETESRCEIAARRICSQAALTTTQGGLARWDRD